MRPNKRLIVNTVTGIFALFLYCEYLIYYVVLFHCDWPELDPTEQDETISDYGQEPVKAMVIADTHLLGSRHGHWFDKLRREWQMQRTFQTSIKLHKPDVVFVLGDLFDEGQYCSDKEFEYYVKRFHKLFALPENIEMFVVAGNHDMGFHYWVSPYLNGRFASAFNITGVELVTIKGNHFVLLNSMAMEEDGCFLCKPAEQQLTLIERALKCVKGTLTDKCPKKFKLKTYNRPILLQHYPLYRDSDRECDGIDSAPEPIKSERFREKWECLSKSATNKLLTKLSPRVVMSGHTHHGCTRKISSVEGVELTIPSFSWRNKKNPTFGMAVITPNNFAFSRCSMPNENTVVNLYMFGGLLLLLWLGYSLLWRTRRQKMKIH